MLMVIPRVAVVLVVVVAPLLLLVVIFFLWQQPCLHWPLWSQPLQLLLSPPPPLL